MTDLQRVILIALWLLLALCVIVSLTLKHTIGGFLEHVAREEEASEEEAEREQKASAQQENET